MTRIVVGEFAHETNTFCYGTTPLADFQENWAEGQEVIERSRGVRDSLGGMIDAAAQLGIELVPTIATSTQPSATIARDAYDFIRDRLIEGIQAAGPYDAICLSLHGAGVAEGITDLEGTLLAEIREAVGQDVPIIVTLDLHGQTTPRMLEHATTILYCHLYPHTDMYDRGHEAVELADKILKGAVKPVSHLVLLPIALPPSSTMTSPANEINERCYAWEAKPGVLDVTFVHGFPHTDIPEIAVAVIATTNDDPALAQEAAEDVATMIWERREEFLSDLANAEEAIQQALASDARPVVIAEVSDNAGGGAPGDGTHLLRTLLEHDLPETCFSFIWDPETAEQAHAAGAGSTITVRLGGKYDDLHGAPIETEAYVKCLTDGRFILQNPMGAGAQEELGKMARLVIGNVDVIVSSRRSQTLDAETFLLHGIDVTRYKIVAIKSQQHFRGGFNHLAGLIIRCDTPGLTTSNLDALPFERVTRPIWPLDPDTRWP
jgi:microcystin degradation protein MlrC